MKISYRDSELLSRHEKLTDGKGTDRWTDEETDGRTDGGHDIIRPVFEGRIKMTNCLNSYAITQFSFWAKW